MNTHIIQNSAPLVYNGHGITVKAETLSLTDMWKAAGEPEGKRPANWQRKEGAPFIEAVSLSLNVPVGHIIKTQRGKGGATLAHWQIALAYAKYLSPEFHMWCNQVVRERMEGRSVATANLPDEVLELIRRSDGIARMLAHKVTEIEKRVCDMIMVDGVTAGEVCDLAKVATNYPRGLSGRVSRRLTQFCIRHGERPRVSRLGRVRAQLFPTNLVREWLDIEGRTLIRGWIQEKQAQGALRLVNRRAA
ncbi:antirepressor KilA [Brucella phage BiPBO1]|uniref:transcriptional regulator n=1 Tax=Brucella phage BiPBO1 TaxID=1718278 RepID=UPI00046C9558|nr:KilA-N domain-containing protein [Brucella inopinata]YP_009304051.1 transcriptional regulator [Brucella phage BiPBO1]ALJ98237.1 antirepressor KilA [Brucella phage BiPBO1]KEY03590.1 hypothetical protein IL59_0215650 [Brucella suis bv. 4 str. 40]